MATGKPLKGVSFAIYNSNKELLAEGKTNADGILRFDEIAYGNYYWQETSTIDGYIPQPGFHEFSVTEDGQVISVVVENEPVPDIPQTGDNSNLPLWYTLMAVSGASIVGLLFYGKKRKCKV